MSTHPMCDRWSACSREREAIESFLDWCHGKGVVLRSWSAPVYEQPGPLDIGETRLLAEFFEIDLEQLERERREIQNAYQDAIERGPEAKRGWGGIR